MNTLLIVALAVVALCYCGGKYCPKVLSSNKEVLLGVLVGMALCSFAGLRLEGFDLDLSNPDHSMKFQVGCCNDDNSVKSECLQWGMDGLTPEQNAGIRNGLCNTRGGDVRSCSDGPHQVTTDRPVINKNLGDSCSEHFECCIKVNRE